MNGILHDIRFAIRSLVRSGNFTLLAVIILAIALGANALVFSLVNGVLLRPLPFHEQERLMTVNEVVPSRNFQEIGLAYPNYVDLRRDNSVLKDLAIYRTDRVTISGGRAEELEAAMVSEGFFKVLGTAPLVGRVFTAEDEGAKSNPTAILGYEVWKTHFGGDPNVVGKTVMLEAKPTKVIGVMPPEIRFPQRTDVWIPIDEEVKTSKRTDHYMEAVGRLKDGVSKDQAQSQLASMMEQINQANAVTSYGQTIRLAELRQQLGSEYRQQARVLLAAVGMVLLIACANLMNLLLARGTGRARELAVRAAIGAPRWRLIRQLMMEAVVLVAMGASLGLLMAVWARPLLLRLIPVDLPYWMRFDMDWRVVAFLVASSLVAAVIAGLMPALRDSAVEPVSALKEGGRAAGTPARRRMRALLVVGELAISLVLLIGAGLLIRSMQAIVKIDPGYDTRNLLQVGVRLPETKYKSEQRVEFYRRLMAEMDSIPGVKAAAATSTPPLQGRWGRSVTAEGAPVLSVKDAPMVNHSSVTPNYFRTMKIGIIEGRDFTEHDTKQERVTIVDKRLADNYWPGQSAVGKRVRFGPPESNEPWHTIVGVVQAVQSQDLMSQGRWDVYLPEPEVPVPGMAVLLRTEGDPLSVAASVRARVEGMDPDLAVSRVTSYEKVVHDFTWQQRFVAVLLSVFSAIALLLASVGLYGVISYSVGQRVHELGVRLALGARPADVLRMVMHEGITLAVIGIVVGAAVAIPLAKSISALLFRVNASDPRTLVVVAGLMTAVAALATYVPARRAMRTDPMQLLRYE